MVDELKAEEVGLGEPDNEDQSDHASPSASGANLASVDKGG